MRRKPIAISRAARPTENCSSPSANPAQLREPREPRELREPREPVYWPRLTQMATCSRRARAALFAVGVCGSVAVALTGAQTPSPPPAPQAAVAAVTPRAMLDTYCVG